MSNIKDEKNNNTLDNIKNRNLDENKNINIIHNNKKTIQEELIYFKNDILKDIKNLEFKLVQKYDYQKNDLEKKLADIELKNNTINQKLLNVIEKIHLENINQEKITILEEFKKKADETLYTHEYRIKNLNKELHDGLNKYDKIVLDNILYPGIIGKYKFKNFREVIDYLLMNVNKLLNDKEKDNIEIKENKNKMKGFSINFGQQLNMNYLNEFITKIIKENIKDYKNSNNNIENLKKEIFVFNEKFKLFEESIKNINNDIENKISEKSEELYIKINDIISNIKIIQNKYNEYISDLDLMKQEVKSFKIVVNDLLLKLNINNQLNKKESFFNKNINNNYNLNYKDIIKNINKININNLKDSSNNINNTINFEENTSNNNNNNLHNLHNSNSIIKQYINGLITLSDINNHTKTISKDSSIPNYNKIINKHNKKNNKKNDKEEDLIYINQNRNSMIISQNNKNLENERYTSINNEDNEDKKNSKKNPNELNNEINKDKNNNRKSNSLILNKNNYFNDINLIHNNSHNNYEKEMLSNFRINEVNLSLINDINNSFNNEYKDINIIKFLIEKNRERYYNNKKNNNSLNDFFQKNENKQSIEGRLQTQTSKTLKKGILCSDYPLNINISNEKNNSSVERKINNNLSLNLINKINKQSLINNYNKNISKHKNIILFKDKNNIEINKDNKQIKEKDNYKEVQKLNKIEVNFDDTKIVEKKEKDKLVNEIDKIKNILPKDEKDIFLDRMKKLGYIKNKNVNKKNNNSMIIKKNYKKYQINSINKSCDYKNNNN